MAVYDFAPAADGAVAVWVDGQDLAKAPNPKHAPFGQLASVEAPYPNRIGVRRGYIVAAAERAHLNYSAEATIEVLANPDDRLLIDTAWVRGPTICIVCRVLDVGPVAP